MTAADLRPLYVRGDASVVVARDGPSLLVTGEGRPPLRAPLRRLSRVVLAGRVRIEQPALIACMEARVPIAFLSASGQTRGWCLGVPREGERDAAADLDHSLRRFLATPEWRSALETWRDAAERRAILRLCRTLHLPLADLRPRAVLALVWSRARAHGAVEPAAVLRRLEGCLDAQLVAVLAAAGVAPRWLGHPGAPIDLVALMRPAVAWSLWPPALRLLEYLARHGRKHREAAALEARSLRSYEAVAPGVEARVRRLLVDLQTFLWEEMP